MLDETDIDLPLFELYSFVSGTVHIHTVHCTSPLFNCCSSYKLLYHDLDIIMKRMECASPEYKKVTRYFFKWATGVPLTSK